MRWTRLHGVAAAIAVASCLAGPPQSQREPPGLALRSLTRLVQVSVAVRDRRGAAVRGLSKDDFVLSENGAAQQISFFTAEAALEKAPVKLPELPPGAVSNRTEMAGGATVLLLDGLNTTAIYRERAAPRIAEFLRAVAPLERIAIYVLRSDLTVVVDFTTDRATLLSENSGADPARASAVLFGRGDSRDLAADLALWAMSREYQSIPIDHVRATCNALRVIADRVRGIPGRKNLVWVTADFPLLIGRQSFTAQFDRAGREVAEDAQASYTLGYYPSNREFDGKFRRIQVRVNRPALLVRHRSGYYAVPETEPGSGAGPGGPCGRGLEPAGRHRSWAGRMARTGHGHRAGGGHPAARRDAAR